MSIKGIKIDLNKTVDNLSIEEQANIYFESRKHALKYLNYGELEKSYKKILKGDRLRSAKSSQDSDGLFHKAHHKYLEYDCAYNQFKIYRTLLMAQHEKSQGLVNVLIEIKTMKELLENKTNVKEVIMFLDNEYDQRYDELKESAYLAAAMHEDLMNIDNFKKYNYFEDIDPIGHTIEDLEPERFNQISSEIRERMDKANQSKLNNLENAILRLRD